MRILIADGDSRSAELLRHTLDKYGHDVAIATNGLSALSTLQQTGNGYEVLISAWHLPSLDSINLLKELRRDEKNNAGTAYRYVILLVGPREAENRRFALESGADDFLIHPVDEEELLARLEVARRVLGLQRDVQSRTRRLEALQGQMMQSGQMIGEILLAQGVITSEHLRHALAQQARTGQMIGPTLIANGWATEEDITRARASQMDVAYVKVSDEIPDPILLEQVPAELARTHRVLPLSIRRNFGIEVVRVAVVNPWNIEGLDAIQRLTGRRVEPLLASEAALEAATAKAYRVVVERQQADLLTRQVEKSEKSPFNRPKRLDEDLDAALSESVNTNDEAPIIRLVNVVLAEGIRRRASDIHIEPYKTDFEIRYRIDGDLHVIRTMPQQVLQSFTSRLKIMAEMDISERRLPQDGRIAIRVDNRGVDLRVSSLPTQFGERLVLRVLDRASARLSLDQLDFSPHNRQIFDGLIRRPHGIILVTGPTGSGKTTTLYASLNALKSPMTNIMTCEDPIEYELDRISQSAVNPRAGLTFAAQLRAILRQDPDVVLVGEIRDAETAETAFRAALTGHLVLSTLHCNEAAGAPTRLMDMGVPPFLIASALIGVVAQRLVKRLCPHCRVATPATTEQQLIMDALAGKELAVERLYRSRGCDNCDGRGTRGRIGVHEVLPIDDRIQAEILRRGDTRALREIALSGKMIPLVSDGIEKARLGLTTLDEVQRRLAAES